MPVIRSAAVIVARHGGPDVLEFGEIDVPEPGEGELRIVQQAVGLNYADVYQRSGAHGPHRPSAFPFVPGSQGAGIVEAIGVGVSGFTIGQAVATIHPGAYAAVRIVPAHRTVALPDGLSIESSAASLLRGMTAEYLLRRLYRVQPGDSVLVHAAAGGMGQILCAWARALGAQVIGTVGSEAKRAIALANGCHHVIDYRRERFAPRVLELTGGEGVAVVYDAVGRDVFVESLDCLRQRGIAINYGTASGDVEAFDLQRLHARSLSVCRPTLRSFIATAQELRESAATFACAVRESAVPAVVSRRYSLKDVVRAHEDLEGRGTTGAAILVP